MNDSDIYVGITLSILHLIYISRGSKNSQQSMLDNPDKNNISIENYYQEILQTFILLFYVYFPNSSTIVYLETIANIQC